MKRKVALLLSLIFMLTMVLPLQSYAAEMDRELENAIRTAKSKFTIPEDYKFTSSIYTSQSKKIYELQWRSRDTIDGVNINVSVDGNGTILYYYRYSSEDYRRERRLPELSREEAKVRADEYIEHIAPGLLQDLKYQEEYQDNVMDINYYLRYYRVENGVPYYNDGVSIGINRDTGELQSYSLNWTEDLEFPSPEGAISLEEAEKAYMDELGLRLIYSFTRDDDVLRAFPLYTTIYDNMDFVIDALSGRKLRLEYSIYGYAAGDADFIAEEKQAPTMAAGESIRLSPEELKAIQEAAKLISLEEAERLVRSSEFLGIPDEYEMQNYYLYTSWPDNREYIWSLRFNKPSEDDRIRSDYVNVSINAKSKEITSFYSYKNQQDAGQKQPIKDLAGAKEDVNAFLRKYYPKYFEQLEYNWMIEEYMDDAAAKEDSYYITYTRLVDGVPFPENGVSISYDNLNGEINSFSLDWFDMEFPSVKNVISRDDAHKILFDKIGLLMEYRYGAGPVIPLMAAEDRKQARAALVYSLSPDKPLYIDANNGNIVYRDGSEYVEPKKVSYKDIEGHFAQKQISVLADFGIYLDGDEFRPNDAITQKDFLTLLSRTLSYYGPIITGSSSQKEIDEFYAYLVREGIIRESEIAPDSTVAREEAVKYIIRALKYDKVAEIRGIFNINFMDGDSISPELYGYVAIASGLGIVNGNGANFMPKKNTTRGEAAVMIYNYLRL